MNICPKTICPNIINKRNGVRNTFVYNQTASSVSFSSQFQESEFSFFTEGRLRHKEQLRPVFHCQLRQTERRHLNAYGSLYSPNK